MPRQKASAKINTLTKMQADLAAKLKEAQRQAREETKAAARKRHEIAGAVALRELADNPKSAFSKALLTLMGEKVTRPGERALFDLGEDKASPEKTVEAVE